MKLLSALVLIFAFDLAGAGACVRAGAGAGACAVDLAFTNFFTLIFNLISYDFDF